MTARITRLDADGNPTGPTFEADVWFDWSDLPVTVEDECAAVALSEPRTITVEIEYVDWDLLALLLGDETWEADPRGRY